MMLSEENSLNHNPHKIFFYFQSENCVNSIVLGFPFEAYPTVAMWVILLIINGFQICELKQINRHKAAQPYRTTAKRRIENLDESASRI